MGRKIEALNEDNKALEHDGFIETTDQVLEVYIGYSFTAPNKKIGVCAEHMSDGVGEEKVDFFFLTHCIFPEANADEQIVRLRVECPGARLFGRCALSVMQYDASGNEIKQS